jgi:hypothetical protein
MQAKIGILCGGVRFHEFVRQLCASCYNRCSTYSVPVQSFGASRHKAGSCGLEKPALLSADLHSLEPHQLLAILPVQPNLSNSRGLLVRIFAKALLPTAHHGFSFPFTMLRLFECNVTC